MSDEENNRRAFIAAGGIIIVDRRFRSTSLSKLHDKAPGLMEEITKPQIERAKRQEMLEKLEDVEEAEGEEAVEEAQEAEKQDLIERMRDREIATFKIQGKPYQEMEALHEFLIELTVEVEGYKDRDGRKLLWEKASGSEKAWFFDAVVPNSSKVSMVMWAVARKHGVPTSMRTPEEAREDLEEIEKKIEQMQNEQGDEGDETDDGDDQ